MEFDFDINSLFPQTITRTVGGELPLANNRSQNELRDRVRAVVDQMGLASGKAQGLHAPITTFQKLQSSNQVLYVMCEEEERKKSDRGAVVGILKVGQKRLFLNDPSGVQHEVQPVCVLDFYVHESKQRSGCGKRLFEAMLKTEGLKPFEVAIDRPSAKFLSFLRKHYKLQSYMKQANNYVVFDQFFTTCVDVARTSRRLSLQKDADTSLSPPVRADNRVTRFSKDPYSSGASDSDSPLRRQGDKRLIAKESPFGSKQDQWPNDFNWSPECAGKRQSSNLQHTSRTVRQNYNIITGVPLLSNSTFKSDQALATSHTQAHNRTPTSYRVRFNSRVEEDKATSDRTLMFSDGERTTQDGGVGHAPHKPTPKAPHLNMRHNKNGGGHLLPAQSSSAANMAAASGFYTTSTRQQQQHRTALEGGGYSRHHSGYHGDESSVRGESGKKGLLSAAGLTGASSFPHHSSAKRQLKDKWKDYII